MSSPSKTSTFSPPRVVRLLTAALAAMLLLAACGGDGTDPEPSDPEPGTGAEQPDTDVDEEADVDEAATAAAEPLTPVTVAFDWLPTYEFSGNWIADDAGFYEDNGLEVDFLFGGPNSPAPEVSIAAGEAQIALTSNVTRLFDAMSDDQDLVILGAVAQRSPIGMLSLAERPVRTVDELSGARILTGEGNRETVASMMSLLGVEDYEFVPAGFSVEPLLAGEGDALWAFETNQAVTLEREFGLVRDEDFFHVTNAELGRPTYANMIIADRAWAEAHRAEVIAFLKGTVSGWEEFFVDLERGPRLAVDVYGSELGLDFDTEVRKAELLAPYIESDDTREHGLLWVNVDLLDGPIFDGLRAAGRDQLPNAGDVVDLSYLEQALAD